MWPLVPLVPKLQFGNEERGTHLLMVVSLLRRCVLVRVLPPLFLGDKGRR